MGKNDGSCRDIYGEEIEKTINGLRLFGEYWLRKKATWDSELFQLADPDFYFYRFSIRRQEQASLEMLVNIIGRVLDRYGVHSEPTDETPFDFILENSAGKVGYTFDDFYEDDDIDGICEEYELQKVIIIRTWKPGNANRWIERENKEYDSHGGRIEAILFKTFYTELFGEQEYVDLMKALDNYLQEARNITGYKLIKFLSSMNLASQRLFEEKVLMEWDYESYRYQVVNYDNKEIKKQLYLAGYDIPKEIYDLIERQYLGNERFKAMVGTSEFAESFITSEWLYHSLKEKDNFDYTAVISGYLKSVEQLLYQIVMSNINNKCKISMRNNRIKEAQKNSIQIYKQTGKDWVPLSEGERTRFPYIDFTTAQEKYMDSSTGTFEHFIRKNPHILIKPEMSKIIADIIACFRTECRNGFFHTHNLNDWDVARKVRENAIFIYFVLLGGCVTPEDKRDALGIISRDLFDEMCVIIRETRCIGFIFEYSDGSKINLVYDPINNTPEYTDDGIEHYDSLLLYKVEDFSLETYEKLEKGISEGQKTYLTRESIPKRIIAVYGSNKTQDVFNNPYTSSIER